jgi:hypothetical protein
MSKVIIDLPHQLLKEIVKVWVEKSSDITRVYEEQTFGGRKLDLVGEKMVSGFDEPLRVFFEIETDVPKSTYINEYLEFCKKQRPFEAYLIAPTQKIEYRYWDDERFQYKRTLTIMPFTDVWHEINVFFNVRFEVVKGKVILLLEEK